jgi:hypothetical protein
VELLRCQQEDGSSCDLRPLDAFSPAMPLTVHAERDAHVDRSVAVTR